ncbi:MAG: DUF3455 domain-containing protein [Paraburkholderia sp.]|nr:MAG: DUF3455 domain-containing protein [Paraburkholderia sp.]
MQRKHHDIATGAASRFNPRASKADRRTSISAHVAAIALLIVATGCAAPPSPPVNADLPEGLRAYPGAILDDVLSARGQVVYECDRSGADLSWAYRGVESPLFDSAGKRIGTAAPGGYFMADDGSYAVTRVDAKASMGPQDLSWARLVSRFNAGALEGTGRFARTQLIQRVNTKGGVAPDGVCANEGAMLYAPYRATYLIYRAPASANAARSNSRADTSAVQSASVSGKTLPLPAR